METNFHDKGNLWRVESKLIAGDVILDVQGVPALDLLVLVLQTLVPVLEPLPFSSDPQLTPTCGGDRPGCCPGVRVAQLASALPAAGKEPSTNHFGSKRRASSSAFRSIWSSVTYRCSRWTFRCRNPTPRYLKSSWLARCV